ncbi:MAG: Protein ImuB [Pseudomonadales bacterium]|nr:Protein ImuB [Pseudomonadales bacterium]
MLWLHLEFPLLALEIFTRDLPADERPLAIVEQQRVLCQDARALACGVVAGIPLATAQALCPQLRTIERRPDHEAAALLELADWSCRFTSLSSCVPPAALLLEIGASLRLFGGAPALLRQVEEQLRERGYTHRCGLAPTPAAAGLLARALPCTHAGIPPWCVDGDRTAFLAQLGALPLALLELPEAQRQRLRRMGLRRIGELLALPRAALGRRFGNELPQRLARLGGELPDPRSAHRPREFFLAERQFPEALHHCAALLFPMQRMLRELGGFLERHQAHCQRLLWRLRDTAGEQRELVLACSLRHHDHAALLELTRLQLDGVRITEPVESLALLCRDFVPTHPCNTTLFGSPAEGDAQATLELLLDRLALRVGQDRVLGLGLADAHLPEQAWCDPRRGMTARAAATPAAQRPAWLLREPLPLAGDAAGLRCDGRLQLLRGPERIESGWWCEQTRRDYFVARREHDGALCWVFRDRASRRWFLQGFFG